MNEKDSLRRDDRGGGSHDSSSSTINDKNNTTRDKRRIERRNSINPLHEPTLYHSGRLDWLYTSNPLRSKDNDTESIFDVQLENTFRDFIFGDMRKEDDNDDDEEEAMRLASPSSFRTHEVGNQQKQQRFTSFVSKLLPRGRQSSSSSSSPSSSSSSSSWNARKFRLLVFVVFVLFLTIAAIAGIVGSRINVRRDDAFGYSNLNNDNNNNNNNGDDGYYLYDVHYYDPHSMDRIKRYRTDQTPDNNIDERYSHYDDDADDEYDNEYDDNDSKNDNKIYVKRIPPEIWRKNNNNNNDDASLFSY